MRKLKSSLLSQSFDLNRPSLSISRFSEWLSDSCLMPTQQFSAISWREQVNFQRDDDEVSFAGFDTNFPSILVQRAKSLRI